MITNIGVIEMKIVRYADARVSVHDLTIGEVEKRKEMLKALKPKLKSSLPEEEFIDCYATLSYIFLG